MSSFIQRFLKMISSERRGFAMDEPPIGEAARFVYLANVLGSSVSEAFDFYVHVKSSTRSRITLDEITEIVLRLPVEQRTVQQVSQAVLEFERTGSLPPRPAPRIRWNEAPIAQPKPPEPEKEPHIRTRKRDKSSREDRVEWGTSGETGAQAGSFDPGSLVGVEDAFEHTPLMPGERVAYCKYDGVAYHLSTWEFLRLENGGRCCSCGKAGQIELITLPPGSGLAVPPLPAQPVWMGGEQKIIRLEQVYEHINHAVVVEDFVHEVYQTKNTGTFFVRFQKREPRTPPFEGFKVVIFAKYLSGWSNQSLSPKIYEGHLVRVRGVIQSHPEWGIEILVNSPRVIQIIDEAQESR